VREPTRQFLLGFLSGSLVSVGFGLMLVYGLLGWFLHHMFIVGVHSAVGLLWFLFPALLVAAGVLLGIRSTNHEVPPQRGRQALGMLFVLLPLLLLAAFPFFGILLGSLGVDIHWNASRASGYVVALCVVLSLCLSLLVGWRLLRYKNSAS
jgi:hypothetical protein